MTELIDRSGADRRIISRSSINRKKTPTVSTLTSDDKPRNNKLHPLFGGHNRERAPVPISARCLTIMRMLGFAVTSGGEKSIHPAAAAARATAATAAVVATLRYPIVAVNCYNGHARGRTIKAGR